MKATFFFFALILCAADLQAQTVYSVPGDSKDNQIVLTIANTSRDASTRSIEVVAVKHPAAVRFGQLRKQLKPLNPEEEVDCAFVFDVSREAKSNIRDTLQFQILDGSFLLGTKSIVVEYMGPQVYSLDQNYPNPFNPTTTIQYQIPLDGLVTLKVYDLLGREVTTLVNEEQKTDYYKVRFDGNNLASGVYFYRIQTGSFSDTKRFVLLK